MLNNIIPISNVAIENVARYNNVPVLGTTPYTTASLKQETAEYTGFKEKII